MALGVKGSRSIVVDGLAYRWKVRRKPSYAQLLGDSNLVFAVERSDVVSGQVLVVDTGQLRADAALPAETAAVTPARVAQAIQSALAAGWTPDAPGAPFRVSLPRGPM